MREGPDRRIASSSAARAHAAAWPRLGPLAVVLALCCTAAAWAVQVPRDDLPNPRLTPGAAFADVGIARICQAGYASSVRDVTSAEKAEVYARYGVVDTPGRHEVDHLVSLEIGGSNSITNLWPEPYAGEWGARTKDRLEDRLHELVCSGGLALATAQREEARDWPAAYLRYVGAPVSTKGGPTPSDPGGFYASSYPTARTIYCADDPAWKSLSKRYLQHFATWARAIAAHPSYHLHRPC